MQCKTLILCLGYHLVQISAFDYKICFRQEIATGFLDPILHEWSQPPQPLVHSLVKPFHQTERFQHSTITESTLSRAVHMLSSLLNKSTSRYCIVSASF